MVFEQNVTLPLNSTYILLVKEMYVKLFRVNSWHHGMKFPQSN